MATIDETLQTAFRHHQAGRLADAEQLYRQVLAANPGHADAIYLLGVIARQVGRHQTAIELFTQAIAVQGSTAHYHQQLGEVLQLLDRADEARAALRRAAELDPRSISAHFHLGLLEAGLGNVAEAERHYGQALAIMPDLVEALVNLGDVQRHARRLEEASTNYRKALAARPDCFEAIHNLGCTLLDLEQFAEAAESLEKARAMHADIPAVHHNLGSAYRGLGRQDDALACFHEAIRLQADFVQPRCGIAGVWHDRGELEQAAEAFRAALAIAPDHVEALTNYGKVLQTTGQLYEALDCYNRAIELQPDLAVAHFNRAVLYNELAQPDQALQMSRKALPYDSNPARLYGNMAVAMHLQGRGREAIEFYRKATAMRPESAVGQSNLLYAMNFCDGFSPQEVFDEHLAWAARHAEPLTAAAPPAVTDPTPDRRVRIGYVSPFFRHHAVNYFTEPIFSHHDRRQFEVFCYSDVRRPDVTTERIRTCVDHWRDTVNDTAEQLANRVRDDRIDILVDLTGHIGGSRLLAFARKPAPIQVTYLGYQHTTGMSAIDYRLTDARADPPGVTDRYYTEKLVRLSPVFFCYRPLATAPAVNALPAETNGFVTFGSFNNFMKVTERVLSTWVEVLARVPRSRLLLLAYRGGYAERHLHEMAAARGVAADRVEFFDKMSTDEYLQVQQRADIALDPFPFNGHTTTCDSIWLGLPVVMLEGQTYASRFGGCVLAHLEMDRLIARSTDEYVERAVELASDLPALARLRRELRPRMAASVLMDHQGFTRELERAYRQMWLDWCRRQATVA